MATSAGPAAQKLATRLAEDFGLLGLSQETPCWDVLRNFEDGVGSNISLEKYEIII